MSSGFSVARKVNLKSCVGFFFLFTIDGKVKAGVREVLAEFSRKIAPGVH